MNKYALASLFRGQMSEAGFEEIGVKDRLLLYQKLEWHKIGKEPIFLKKAAEVRSENKVRKLLLFLLFALISYTVFVDLTDGTLQMLDAKSNPVPENESKHFETITVKKGDTVLSSLEKLNGTLPVTVEEAIQDFKELNPGVDPTMIQTNQTYKFPIYDQMP